MCIAKRQNAQILPKIKKKSLSMLFWNIHGQNSKMLGDKFLDHEFLNKS